METITTCSCEVNHPGHICVLRSEGLTNVIELLTNKPTVSCFICGVEANSEANVCSPVTLKIPYFSAAVFWMGYYRVGRFEDATIKVPLIGSKEDHLLLPRTRSTSK